MSNYMSNATLKSLDVERLEAFLKEPNGRKRPRLKGEERMVWYDPIPTNLDRCRSLALGLTSGVRAPISERLHCCVFALSHMAPPEWHSGPGAIQEQAQATLAHLLMENPVLMHPVLQCVGTKDTTACNHTVVVAVTRPAYSRLPMRHDGYTDAQLGAWFCHPAVQAGLFTLTADDTGLAIGLHGTLPITHAARNYSARPELFASFHDLVEVQRGAADPEVLPRHIGMEIRARAMSAMASSLIAAAEIATVASRRYVEVVRTTYCHTAPEMLRAAGYLAVGDAAARPLRGLTFAERMRRHLDVLVDAGLTADHAGAARAFLSAFNTAGPAGWELPQVVDYLRLLRDHGVTPTDAELIPYPLSQLKHDERMAARQMVAVETAMHAVLNPTVAAGAAAHVDPDTRSDPQRCARAL